jgi:hypothetical protein
MPAKKRRSTAPAAKRTTARASKTAPRERAHGHEHGHDDHEHVEFRLSKKTASLIDAALEGLTSAQQERVLAAVDRVGEEAGETVGRWVEENVVANVNELLAVVVPDLAANDRWDDIRAILRFLEPLDVPVDQTRLQKEVQKAQGAKVAGEYKKEIRGKRR